MPKKVVIFTGYYLPSIGGVQKIVKELAEKLNERGYMVEVITCNTENVLINEKINNISIIRFPCWHILNNTLPVPKINFLFFKLILKIMKNKHDIIITNTRFFPICFIGMIVAKIKKIPLIHYEHGSQHSVLNNQIFFFFGKVFDHSVGSLIVKTANKNFCGSIPSTEFVKHLGGKNIDVLYYGIDTSNYRLTDSENHIESDPLTLVFIGRLIYSKGLQDLISARSKIKKTTRLLIIGDGPYRSHLELQTKNDLNIIFLGEKRFEEIPSFLSQTDIFINPSYSEGFGYTVLEAAAAGCAIIATDVGGTNVIIEDNINGFLIEPGNIDQMKNKLEFLLDNPNIRRQFRNGIKEKIDRTFSWDVTIAKLIKEMESLIRN